jgi:hypothetical protein
MWLTKFEADNLYDQLMSTGKAIQEKMNRMKELNVDIKYPLSTITYGKPRKLDGALALDRWGSYHESWCRVEEPTDVMNKLCSKLRERFNLPETSINSMVMNFYWDGASTYIPAHRDTTVCLEDQR